MPSSDMDINSGTKFIPQIWIAEVRAFLRAKLGLSSMIKSVDFIGKAGDVLHIPNISELTANDKVAQQDVQFQAPSEGEFTLNINQHKESSFLIEDLLRIQSAYNLRSEYTKSAGYAIAKAMDVFVWNLYSTLPAAQQVIGSDGTTAWSATSNGNGADLTDLGIRRLVQFFDDNNVPEEGRVLAIAPSQKNVMLGLSRFTEFQFYGTGAPIHTGMFGEIYGMTVYVSSLAPRVTQGSGNYRVGLCFQKEAFALAKQLNPRVQADYLVWKLGWAVVCDCVFGASTFRSTNAQAVFTT